MVVAQKVFKQEKKILLSETRRISVTLGEIFHPKIVFQEMTPYSNLDTQIMEQVWCTICFCFFFIWKIEVPELYQVISEKIGVKYNKLESKLS